VWETDYGRLVIVPNPELMPNEYELSAPKRVRWENL
jgi:hypothetical protein